MIRVAVGAGVLALLVVLFLRSIESTRATPFTVEAESLSGWTLVREPSQDPLGSWLALRPPVPLTSALGREIFRRGGESVNYPNPALVPLLLQVEFDRAFANRVAPEQILSLATGLASTTWTPRCMAHRRVSEPGLTTGVYFVLLEAAPLDRFRQQLHGLLQAHGDPSLFDPAALSPAMIVAALDGHFGRWMPLRADPAADCVAPVEIT